MKCILRLPSVHQVMKAEKVLKEKGILVDLIPVPREISSDCGVALEFPEEAMREALKILEEHKMRSVDCFARDLNGKLEKVDR